MILIINESKMRLCQDFHWRNHANFGTYSTCVKEYIIAGHARRQARRINGTVVKIPNGFEVDASGTVFDLNGKKHQIDEFIQDVPLLNEKQHASV